MAKKKTKKRSRKTPNDVFTPRNPDVNDVMYVERPELEKQLREAYLGGHHLLIHGESGTGKSWLYKKVFKNHKTPYYISNLANASRLGSINNEFKNLIDRHKRPREPATRSKKKAD